MPLAALTALAALSALVAVVADARLADHRKRRI